MSAELQASASASPRAEPVDRSRTGSARLYALYAAGFLVLTLLSGVWLRTVFVVPEALIGFRFPFALHAHSHVAFFGWTTMALFAVLVDRFFRSRRTVALRVHAHVVGTASAAAFAGFLLTGYAAATIALSVLHVVLWFAFVLIAWPWLDDAAPLERRYWRAALGFLAIAGLGAMTPGIVMLRQIADPWLGQLSIKSFLTPFVSGWLILGVMGTVYGVIERRRFALVALWLTAAGVVPSVLLHTSTPPPAEWMTLLGRVGTALVGAGTLLFAADVLASRNAAPLLRLAGAAALLKGTAELLVSTGILLDLATSHQLTVAYLHLVLLGMVTPALIASALQVGAAPRRAVVYATGLAFMVGALAAIGWPRVALLVSRFGLEANLLFRIALVGGAVCALAGIALLHGSALWRRGAGRAAEVGKGRDARLPAGR